MVSVSAAAVCYAFEEGALVPCQSHCADWFHDMVFDILNTPYEATFKGIVLSPQNQTYLIDWDNRIYQWALQQAEPWQYLCTLDTSSLDFKYLNGFTVNGDMLYGCNLEFDGTVTQGTAFSFSLTSGACEKLFTSPSMMYAYPVDESRMLIAGPDIDPRFANMGFYNTYLYDITTGQKSMFYRNDIYGLVPDGRGGWYGVTISSGNGLFHFDEEGNGEKVIVLPDSSLIWDCQVSLSEDRTTAYVTDKGSGRLGVYSVGAGEIPELLMGPEPERVRTEQ